MKDIIVKLLGFYVDYRMDLNLLKRDFWKSIAYEWFHKPLTHEEFIELVGGIKK